MSLDHTVQQREGYAVVRVKGDPSLGELLAFIQYMGTETAAWPTRRVLFDLRGVRSLTSFTDHYAVGEETARQLRHLHRIASIVDPDRITRASEKTARQSGANLCVFITEAEALAWLTD
jgi:hypothetical protein